MYAKRMRYDNALALVRREQSAESTEVLTLSRQVADPSQLTDEDLDGLGGVRRAEAGERGPGEQRRAPWCRVEEGLCGVFGGRHVILSAGGHAG